MINSWISSVASSILPIYIEWLRLYPIAIELLGIDPARDQLATYLLRDLLASSRGRALGLDYTKSALRGVAIVVGAGPSLERVLPRIADALPKATLIVAADGATRALVEIGVVPTAIASDLDGDIDALIKACRAGSTLFLHAHGDNIESVAELYPELSKACRNIVGTTQVPNPPQPLLNLGGFTDGDRASIIAYLLGARKILLLGMDLSSSYTGRYSKGVEMRALRAKLVKLWVARMVLESLGRMVELIEVGTRCLTFARCASVEEARAMVLNWIG